MLPFHTHKTPCCVPLPVHTGGQASGSNGPARSSSSETAPLLAPAEGEAEAPKGSRGLSMLGGVFVPCVLTIMGGVFLFLRMGFVVGQVW